MYFARSVGGKRASTRASTVTVKFMDKKTGKVRHFKAKVKQPKYRSTDEMIKGMANNDVHPALIVQAVSKRDKVSVASAKTHVLKVRPGLKSKFGKKKSRSSTKRRAVKRNSRKRTGGSYTKRKSRARSPNMSWW